MAMIRGMKRYSRSMAVVARGVAVRGYGVLPRMADDIARDVFEATLAFLHHALLPAKTRRRRDVAIYSYILSVIFPTDKCVQRQR